MRLKFVGPAPIAGLYAQMLRDEGLSVLSDSDDAVERRGLVQDAAHVVLTVAGLVATADGVASVVARVTKEFKKRFPDTRVTDEDGRPVDGA